MILTRLQSHIVRTRPMKWRNDNRKKEEQPEGVGQGNTNKSAGDAPAPAVSFFQLFR